MLHNSAAEPGRSVEDSASMLGFPGAKGPALEQRRFLFGLVAIMAVWAPLFWYIARMTGRGVAPLFGAISLVALSGYVLFHHRVSDEERGGEGKWARWSGPGRALALAMSLVLGVVGFRLYHGGAADTGEVGMVLSALSLLAWLRLGAREAGDGGRNGAQLGAESTMRGGAPRDRGRLPPAQVEFLWGLSALVVCGFVVVFVIALSDFGQPVAVIGLGVFGVLAAGVFVRLIWLTWPILAVAGGAGVLKSALIASGVFLVGLGMVCYLVASSVTGVLGSKQATGQKAELVRFAPARIVSPQPVAWPRPLPGDADLIELGSADRHVRADGSVFERVAEAVVTIRTASGHGTAFLITRDGLAITNNHVVDVAGPAVAVFRDGRERPTRVVRNSAARDVALLQVACESDCTTVELASDDELRVGGEIFVIGTPRGEVLHHSMTRGIISGLRYDPGSTAIQTDAAINHGNSGSPIIDASSGHVVGIVTSSLRGNHIEGVHFGIALWDALRELGIRAAVR